MSDWLYHIKPYKQLPGQDGWTPATEADATAWFGFRERGDDHRCFGVFPSRQDAERAAEMIQQNERGKGRSR
jgi:hypothetical protein